MKKVSFNNKVDIKYYNNDLEENHLENFNSIGSNSNSIGSNSNYKYIIGLILTSLCIFFIIYLAI